MSPRGGSRPGAGRKSLIPQKNAVNICLSVEPALLARLDRIVKEAGKSRSAVVVELLRLALYREGNEIGR